MKLGNLEDPVPIEPKPRRGCEGCLLAVVVVVALGFLFVRRCSNPPGMVTVMLRSLPEGAEYLYFVADRRGEIVRLPWYENHPGPFANPELIPIDEEWNREEARVGRDRIVKDVSWPRARRYGVVIRRRDGSWRLWWLDENSLVGPSFMRHLFGGGQAIVRIPEGSTGEVPSRDDLDRLGLTKLHEGSDRPAAVVPR